MIRKLIKYFRMLHWLHTLENARDYYLKYSQEDTHLYLLTERAFRKEIADFKHYLSQYWKR